MADELEVTEDAPRRGRGRTMAKWAGIAVLGVLLFLAAIFAGLNTDPGRRFVVDQINKLELASGLDIQIGRIDGSVYGKMTIRDLRLADNRGVFFEAAVAEVDWRPFAYLSNHIDIRSLTVPSATLARLPELNPSEDPDAPLLPDIDVDVGRLQMGRLLIGPAVTGQRHLVTMDGRAKIADGLAEIAANAATIAAPGMPGGDRFVLRLDAVPEQDRLAIAARLDAPAGGFVARMAGFDQPFAARVAGQGRWSDWRGRAQATLGGDAMANLAIAAQNGTFRVSGPLRPGLMFEEGSVRRLVEPVIRLDLTSILDQRRADTKLRLQSEALAVAAEGMIDLGESRFSGVRVATRLLKPGAIAPNLNGRDIRVALLLDGPFGTPVVAYDLQASAMGFNTTIVEGLRAQGRARVDADRITIPVSARARRITGLNPAVGSLATNVAIDGSFAISGTTVLSDNLKIRSDRINATAVIVADLAKGMYRAGIQGRIDNYLVEGVGLLDLDSNIDIVSEGAGFGLKGRLAFRTRRIDNASARDFLGGNAVGSVGIRMNSGGTFFIDSVRMTAPRFRILSGSGRYDPDGRIALRASAVSADYGPLSVVITGTAERPQIDLRAERPGLGIGLRGVQARVRATAEGYAITATGESDYGPFSADVVVLSGRGPLTIQVNRVTIAGLNFAGRIVQTPAGPFSGTLTLSGSGLNGTVRLSAEGANQRADIAATANGASIPSDPPILIQRAIVRATAILYPQGPAINGDAQFAGVRRDQTLIRTARAKIDYRGGRGKLQLTADGTSGVPFRIAANADITPDHIRTAMQGSVNNLAFRLQRPADIRRDGRDWMLSPTAIVFPQGRVLVAGRYGDGLTLRSRIDNLDLSIVNAFSPALGIGGKASGTLDFAQASSTAFPRADARLNITGFTRAGVATLSAPVDIALAGQLSPDGGLANAVIRRRGGAVIGRLQAQLQPLSSAAGSWSERLLASPLTGGIRYNGPAEVLWSLSGIAGRQLSGPIAIAADFSGRVQAPQLNGILRANALTFVDETYGTRITNIALQGRFTQSRFEITQFNGRAGEGTISGRGSVGLAADAGFPIDIRVQLDRARLARSDAIGATATGNIAITNGPNQPALISGELQLPEVRYEIVRQGAAEIAELEGVRRKGDPLPRPGERANAQATAPSIWNLDLRVRADNEVFVSGMGLESEWSTDLRLRGTSNAPVVVGTADLIRGTYSFAGNRFELTQGEVAFTGSTPINPRIRMAATTEVDNVAITINITGTGTNPQIVFSSSPALPQDEILSRLLFGGPVTQLSALQVVQLGSSLNALRGGGGGLNPLGKLRSATGVDRLRVLGADEATGRGTAVAAGFYISNDIYIEVITDARGFTATQLEIALSKSLSLLSQAGSQGSSSASIRYRKEY